METVITNMRALGFFQFLLPFMLTSAIFYGLLRRSKIFGKPEENVVVNAVISLAAAFLVWAYPILIGVNIETYLSQFFFAGTVAMLVIMVGIMAFGMFLEKGVGKLLEEKFKGGGLFGGLLFMGLLIGVAVFLSSGLLNVFIPGGVETPGFPSEEMIYAIMFLVFAGMMIYFLAKPEGKSKE
ncbi:MAG: hypothetical protein J7L39_00745 [Candidatus Aenigmarchaeota archaeon]|nr:hypothetical protein [Candidatus Aenigmarchaeota archaeon]